MGQLHSGPMAGRTVLVTGVGGGIGRATALGPARMGPGDLRPGPREHRGRSRRAQRRWRADRGGVRGRPVRPVGGAARGPHGVFEGVRDQRGGHRGGCSPAGDPAGERIDHARDVGHRVPGRAIGEVGGPITDDRQLIETRRRLASPMPDRCSHGQGARRFFDRRCLSCVSDSRSRPAAGCASEHLS